MHKLRPFAAIPQQKDRPADTVEEISFGLAEKLEGYWGWGDRIEETIRDHEKKEYDVDLPGRLAELLTLGRSGAIRAALNSPYPRNHLRLIGWNMAPLFDLSPISLLAIEHQDEELPDDLRLGPALINTETWKQLYMNGTEQVWNGVLTLPYPECYFVTHEQVNDNDCRFFLRAVQDQTSFRVECVGCWDIVLEYWIHPGFYTMFSRANAGQYVIGSNRLVEDETWRGIGASHLRAVMAFTSLLTQGTVKQHTIDPEPSRSRARNPRRVTFQTSGKRNPLPVFKSVDITGFKYEKPPERPKPTDDAPARTVRPTTRRAHQRRGEPVPVTQVLGGDQDQRHYKVNLGGRFAVPDPEMTPPSPSSDEIGRLMASLEALCLDHPQFAAELHATMARILENHHG
jgi:hypothetical protein